MCRIPGISRWGWNRSKCRHFFHCLPVASLPWCISWTDRQSYPYERRGRYCSPSLPPSPLLTPKRIPGKKGGTEEIRRTGGWSVRKSNPGVERSRKDFPSHFFLLCREPYTVYTYAKLLSLSSDEGKGEEIHKPTLSFFPEKEAFLPNGKERERKGA